MPALKETFMKQLALRQVSERPQQPISSLFSLVSRLIRDATQHTQTLMRSGVDQYDAWNQTSVIHLQAAKVSCLPAEACGMCSLFQAGHCSKKTRVHVLPSPLPHRDCPPLL